VKWGEKFWAGNLKLATASLEHETVSKRKDHRQVSFYLSSLEVYSQRRVDLMSGVGLDFYAAPLSMALMAMIHIEFSQVSACR